MPQSFRFLALPAVLAFAGASALWGAPAQAPGQPDLSRVMAGTYTADAGHTVVEWRVNHMGFADYFGLFGAITGTLVLDPAHPEAAQVAIRVPVSKLVTANPGLTGALLRPNSTGKPDYFGPKPADALFNSTKVTPGADGKSAVIAGNLTLNGITRPVSIAATFTGAGKSPYSGALNVGFQGTARINRSDFGLSADIPLVGEQVELSISATFQKKG